MSNADATQTTQNLLDWYSHSSEGQRAAGIDWYPEASALASTISAATRGRVTERQACGVIAALSPRCSWPDNKRAALSVTLDWAKGTDPDSIRLSGVYPENIAKAFRILDSADFGVCPGCRPAGGHRRDCSAILRGPKVSAFFAAILGADDGAMDVWATRAARVNPAEVWALASDDPRREGVPENLVAYRALEAAYSETARTLGLTARQFQAVVWLTIRDSWIRSDGRVNGRRLDTDTDLPF